MRKCRIIDCFGNVLATDLAEFDSLRYGFEDISTAWSRDPHGIHCLPYRVRLWTRPWGSYLLRYPNQRYCCFAIPKVEIFWRFAGKETLLIHDQGKELLYRPDLPVHSQRPEQRLFEVNEPLQRLKLEARSKELYNYL